MLYSEYNCKLIGMMLACGTMTRDLTQMFLPSHIFKREIKVFLTERNIEFRHEQWSSDRHRVTWRTTGSFPVDMTMMYVYENDNIIKGIPNCVQYLSSEQHIAVLNGLTYCNPTLHFSNVYLCKQVSKILLTQKHIVTFSEHEKGNIPNDIADLHVVHGVYQIVITEEK